MTRPPSHAELHERDLREVRALAVELGVERVRVLVAHRLDDRGEALGGGDQPGVGRRSRDAGTAGSRLALQGCSPLLTGFPASIQASVPPATLVASTPSGVRNSAALRLRPPAAQMTYTGRSVSVSGVCLTVVDQGEDWFTADVMKQTLDMSTLDGVAAGRSVNLERATVAHGRLGGHIVQGHIDGTGDAARGAPRCSVAGAADRAAGSLAPLVVDKGSIAVDGVSLTVSAVSRSADAAEQWFEVSLIPETLAATTLGARARATASTSRPTSWPVTCSGCWPSRRSPRQNPERTKGAAHEPVHHPRGPRGAARGTARHRRRR